MSTTFAPSGAHATLSDELVPMGCCQAGSDAIGFCLPSGDQQTRKQNLLPGCSTVELQAARRLD